MQKILLWSLAGAVSLLLLLNLALGLNTRGSVSKIQAIQAQVANGPQMEIFLLKNASGKKSEVSTENPQNANISGKFGGLGEADPGWSFLGFFWCQSTPNGFLKTS